MTNKKFLVIGATGLVGSQVAIKLAEKGYDVTAMVRTEATLIRDPHAGQIKYVVGDLTDEASLRDAVQGMDIVISTANGVIPQDKNDTGATIFKGARKLVAICEEAGVERFVQSSIGTHPMEDQVPELKGKRSLEKALLASGMQSVIIRNPAFMDVWLVMCGYRQGENRSLHATTKRDYGFMKMWMGLVGNLAKKFGCFIAPGGAQHGCPLVATRDVAEMMVGGALYEGSDDLIIEAGGKKWLSWQEVADTIARRVGREQLRIIPMPAWLARTNQLLFQPFAPAAANLMGLIRFVASEQSRWDSSETVELLGIPEQWSLEEYLDKATQPKEPSLQST